MDANGVRFWSIADEADFDATGPLAYDRQRRTLKLASFRALDLQEPDGAEELLALTPQAWDAFDTYAFFEPLARRISAAGAAPGSVVVVDGLSADVRDLTAGHDGILYAAIDGGVTLFDLRRRWPAHTLADPELDAFRLATQPSAGVLVLDRGRRRVWLARGEPLPSQGLRTFAGDVFRPDDENPNPPRLQPLATLHSGEDPVAIASNASGDTAILFWLAAGQACVRRLGADGRLGPRVLLSGVSRPFSMGWLDAGTLVVLVRVRAGEADTRIAVVPYSLPESETVLEALPLGGVYPLVHHTGGPFAHGPREPARYPSRAPGRAIDDPPRPLVRLSAPELARHGESRPRRIDSGVYGTAWHRLFLEASIPAQCGVRVWLAATDRVAVPDDAAFSPHVFGEADGDGPRGVWSPLPSELPFHPGLLPCVPEPHRVGLFSVLVQRTGHRVSTLTGRFLHVRVELLGNSRQTPELAALRVYGPRFSYVDQYLPRLYREDLFPPDADEAAEQTTPADFLERFLCNFEGVLTPLEDRIANAHLLTDPESAPEEALDWLGQWIGFVFDPGYPPAQRRRALKSAMLLHRWHGTLRGLTLALNILTDDALERGEVVVVEDYRLRRTFATILGADLADEDDPLTAGLVVSGNSIVGDTLILGNEFRREFLALFRERLPERPQGKSVEEWISYIYQRFIDPSIVDDFFDRFAHRLTVLVQKEVSDDRLRLISRVLELEAPAHVEAQVIRASKPFVVGLASLVGVDTFLRAPEAPPATRVDQSRIGTTFLLRSASIDPRLEVGA